MTIQHVYELRVVSGNAEATMLVCAHSKAEAKRLAWDRVVSNDSVAWEGTPDEFFEIVSAEDQGEDPGQAKEKKS